MEVFFHKMISYPSIKWLSMHAAILCKLKIKVLREFSTVFQVKPYPRKKCCWGDHCSIVTHTLQGCNRCLTTTRYLKITAAVFIAQNFHGRTCLQWKARFVIVKNLVFRCYIIFYFELFKFMKPCINRFLSACHCTSLL